MTYHWPTFSPPVPSDHLRPLVSFFFLAFLTPPGEASWWCGWWRGLCFLLGNWSQWAATWLCLHLNPGSLESPASQTLLASLAGPAAPSAQMHEPLSRKGVAQVLNCKYRQASFKMASSSFIKPEYETKYFWSKHPRTSLLDLNASLAKLALIYMLEINVSTGALMHVCASHSSHTENWHCH